MAPSNLSQRGNFSERHRAEAVMDPSAPCLCFIAAGKQLLSLKKNYLSEQLCSMPSLASPGSAACPTPGIAAPTASALPCRCIALLSLPFIPLPPFLFPSLCSRSPMADPGLLQEGDMGTSGSSALAVAFWAGFQFAGPHCPLRWGKAKEKPFPWPPLLFTQTCLSCAPSFLLGGEPSCFGWVWGNRNSLAGRGIIPLCRSSLRALVVEQKKKIKKKSSQQVAGGEIPVLPLERPVKQLPRRDGGCCGQSSPGPVLRHLRRSMHGVGALGTVGLLPFSCLAFFSAHLVASHAKAHGQQLPGLHRISEGGQGGWRVLSSTAIASSPKEPSGAFRDPQ